MFTLADKTLAFEFCRDNIACIFDISHGATAGKNREDNGY